jgi:excisionase family DNA binding protein
MELMTIQEAADALRVKPITVRRYIRSGRLAAVRVGRGLRVEREALEALPEPATTLLRGDQEPYRGKYAKYLKPIPDGDYDPFKGLVGLFDGFDLPTDMSTNKHKYLDEAAADLHRSDG